MNKNIIYRDLFIEKAIEIHNNKYDYSVIEYKNSRTKVKVICPTHGEFLQLPSSHLQGNGCPICGFKKRLDISEFVDKAKQIHKNKYDYSFVIYKNSRIKINIVCPIHGLFEQTPSSHLSKRGCIKCTGLNKLTTKEFIKKANIKHDNKYNYSLVKYENSHTKIKIICPLHGVFNQIAYSHLAGIGCSSCSSSKGELEIKKFLDKNNINYIRQHKFVDCKNQKPLSFDFYLPKGNTCIEYDGEQHFRPVKNFGGEIGFLKTKKFDSIKNEYCKKNNIKLIRIKYNDNKDLKELISFKS